MQLCNFSGKHETSGLVTFYSLFRRIDLKKEASVRMRFRACVCVSVSVCVEGSEIGGKKESV